MQIDHKESVTVDLYIAVSEDLSVCGAHLIIRASRSLDPETANFLFVRDAGAVPMRWRPTAICTGGKSNRVLRVLELRL
jgi:hypothetical protein